MPELPEVETVRLGLSADLVGGTIESVNVFHHRSIRRQPGGSDELAAGMSGRTVRQASRRGKYLWLELEETDHVLVVHLGMSGQLRLVTAMDADPHTRVDFLLSDGRYLRFRDQRTFGWVLYDNTRSVQGEIIPEAVAHIAPDPFDNAFQLETVVDRMSVSRAGIKRILLDQTVISGIGNIYADEALWRAQVHYATPARELDEDQVLRVITSAAEVMTEAIESGGTSFDALYVDVAGDKGWFERSLSAYGCEDEPCPRCGDSIRRERFMNRSSFLCPSCQRP